MNDSVRIGSRSSSHLSPSISPGRAPRPLAPGPDLKPPALGPDPKPQAPSPLPPFTRHLPHHRLVAYSVAVEFLRAVRAAGIGDAKLRDEALRSAKSACLNTAEGAGRVTRADKARTFAIARAEACEAAAAVEIAAAAGEANAARAEEVLRLADRLVALLSGLVR